MSRLLHAPTVDGTARRLDAPVPTLDQATRDLLARVEAEAHQRGVLEGQQAARASFDAAAARVVAAVTDALTVARADREAAEAARAGQVVAVARRLAEAVLGHDLARGGQALVDRVLAAVDALDHGPFTIHLAAADHAVLADQERALPPGTAVVVDPTLHPGEAHVTGPWSGADLTLQAVLDTLLAETGVAP